jgi:hypothetical protein
MAQKYASDVKLGEKYRDPQTGIEGTSTSIHFYQYACERVTLEVVTPDGKLEEYTFDSPRLENVATKKRATTTRTGGPGDGVRQRSSQSGVPSR